MTVVRAGMTGYDEGLDLQRGLLQKRRDGSICDTLVLLEHPPVITFGRRADDADLRVSRDYLDERGVEIRSVERGGQATYHGPGQLVGYAIVDLGGFDNDVRLFVFNLEETLTRLLRDEYGIPADRDPGHHGVWVGDSKIASVGISVRRGITQHGFALNVNTELEPFRWIIPCGIADREVTSLKLILGEGQDMSGVSSLVVRHFCKVFGYEGVNGD